MIGLIPWKRCNWPYAMKKGVIGLMPKERYDMPYIPQERFWKLPINIKCMSDSLSYTNWRVVLVYNNSDTFQAQCLYMKLFFLVSLCKNTCTSTIMYSSNKLTVKHCYFSALLKLTLLTWWTIYMYSNYYSAEFVRLWRMLGSSVVEIWPPKPPSPNWVMSLARRRGHWTKSAR